MVFGRFQKRFLSQSLVKLHKPKSQSLVISILSKVGEIWYHIFVVNKLYTQEV